jgi:hypothetical protein
MLYSFQESAQLLEFISYQTADDILACSQTQLIVKKNLSKEKSSDCGLWCLGFTPSTVVFNFITARLFLKCTNQML